MELAHKLEHVLLRPDVTAGEVDDACAAAVESGLAAVTVRPADLQRAVAAHEGSRVTVVAAIGAPHGLPAGDLRAAIGARGAIGAIGARDAGDAGDAGDTVVAEALRAIQAGAGHVAVALDPGGILRDPAAMAGELEALCRATHAKGVHVRAVLQAHLLDRPALAASARLAAAAGADLLQTGFGLAAPASAEQVLALRSGLPPRRAGIGVIAAGPADTAGVIDLLDGAGADRVAVLDPVAVLRGVAAA